MQTLPRRSVSPVARVESSRDLAFGVYRGAGILYKHSNTENSRTHAIVFASMNANQTNPGWESVSKARFQMGWAARQTQEERYAPL